MNQGKRVINKIFFLDVGTQLLPCNSFYRIMGVIKRKNKRVGLSSDTMVNI